MRVILKKLKILPYIFVLIWGCNYKNSNSIENADDPLLGMKVDFMLHSVIPYNIDSCSYMPSTQSPFKILTYVNSYCFYCWETILPWKEHLNDFVAYPQVSFFCYVAASPDDFDAKNREANLDFPVYLDIDERFRIVNRLGSAPNRLTFLLNEENEIILIGQPFTSEMKENYIKMITAKESTE